MRRAMRHAHLMGCVEPLLWKLVPALVAQMGQAFPELVRAQPMITETLSWRKAVSNRPLERGLKLLDEETASLGKGASLNGVGGLPPL